MAFDQDLTCLIFPLRWAHLPINNSGKAQWVHLFLMNCNGFRSFRLYFSPDRPFLVIKSSHSGNTICIRLLLMKDSTMVELFYFDDNFRRLAQWVLALIPSHLHEQQWSPCQLVRKVLYSSTFHQLSTILMSLFSDV